MVFLCYTVYDGGGESLITWEQKEKIKELSLEDKTIKEIAESLSLTYDQVQGHIWRDKNDFKGEQLGAELHNLRDSMVCEDIRIKDNREEVGIWLASDLHYGNALANLDLFYKIRDRALKEGWYVITLGDLAECGIPGKISRRMYDQSVSTNDQVKDVPKLFKGLKVLSVIKGTHEDFVYDETSIRIDEEWAEKLNAKSMGGGGYLRVKFGKFDYIFALFHGHGSSTKPDYLLEKYSTFMDDYDVLAIGHIHQLYDKRKKVFTLNGEGVSKRKTLWFRTGGFLNYPEYALEKAYPPGEEGSPIVFINRNDKKLRYVLLTEDDF